MIVPSSAWTDTCVDGHGPDSRGELMRVDLSSISEGPRILAATPINIRAGGKPVEKPNIHVAERIRDRREPPCMGLKVSQHPRIKENEG